MSKQIWNVENLKTFLGDHSEVTAWIFEQSKVCRREMYFLMDQGNLAIDQDRDVTARESSIQLFIKSSKVGYQSEITSLLYENLALEPQLKLAIASAKQSEFKQWTLPTSAGSNVPKYLSADPQIAEDLEASARAIADEIKIAVEKPRISHFNSAELFISVHEFDTYMSTGFVHSSARTRIYLEAAFSMNALKADGSTDSNEFMGTRWSVSQKDLGVQKFFDEVASKAEVSTNVVAPQTGSYPVIINHEVLTTLLSSHVTQLAASSIYLGLPTIKSGAPFIVNPSGDLINLRMDPSVAFGAATTSVCDGIAQYPLELVKDNIVTANYCSKRYSDYLQIPVTTTRGNWVLNAGKLSHQQLCASAPFVIEILQFSSINPDSATGTFSSEIRLAKLYNNKDQSVSYLKGGSLSGSMNDNFCKVKFSSETATHTHFEYGDSPCGYQGPAFALLNDVSIVG